jgi:hypothetical protein
MLKFIFNKGKPKIEVEPDIIFNITVDEEGIIREAVRVAREEHVSKLADDFLQAFVKIEPKPREGCINMYFNQHTAAREGGYQSCYNDMKEKIMEMIREEIVDDIQ